MTNRFKKVIATLIACLMLISAMPFTAMAAPAISLSIDNKTDFYAGVELTVIATIVGVNEEQVSHETGAVFEWSAKTDDVIITSANNYRAEAQTDGTYTLTETAKFILPDIVGKQTGISVEYALAGMSKSKDFTLLQPIDSITIDSIIDDSGEDSQAKYLEKVNTVFAETSSSFTCAYTVAPETNDDAISVTGNPQKGVSVAFGASDVNEFSVILNRADVAEFNINLNAAGSGVKKNSFAVVPCSEAIQFGMKLGNTSTSAVATEEEPGATAIEVVQSESLIVAPTAVKPAGCNDEFVYTLENTVTHEVIPDFTVSGNSCILKNTNPGTYTLNCKNVSKGSIEYNNGVSILPRNLEFNVIITVTKAVPITSIRFLELDESGEKTANDLGVLPTLYANTSARSSFNLAKCIQTVPAKDFTDGYTYESGDKAIATVSAEGMVTAVGSGTTRIRAVSKSNPNVFASCEVNVVAGVSSINGITGPSMTIIAGNSMQLRAVTTPLIHDENIGWSIPDSYKDVLTIDQNGIVTANIDYKFDGKSFVDVPVTATSQIDALQAVVYIKVVPLDDVKSVDVLMTDAKGGIIAPDEHSEYSSYAGQTFKLYGSAKNKDGEESNRILVWMVQAENGKQMPIESFGTVVKNSDGSYSITPSLDQVTTNTKLSYYCYATVNGSITESTINTKLDINILSPITTISLSGTKSVIPVGESKDVTIQTAPVGASKEDPLVVVSSSPNVASVELIDNNTAMRITALTRGASTIVVTSKSGNKAVKYEVTVNENISKADVELERYEYVYDGTAHKPAIKSISYNGEELTSLFYANPVYANTINATTDDMPATVTINGASEFSGSSKVIEYKILQKQFVDDASQFTVTLRSATALSDTVSESKASFYVRDIARNVNLAENVDYVIEYSNNTAAGTAIATIKGIGNYKGELVRGFTVTDTAARFAVRPIADQQYTGAAILPEPKVSYNGVELTKDEDYTLKYESNVVVGTAKITITGKAPKFNGSQVVTFNIVPKQIESENTIAKVEITPVSTKTYGFLEKNGETINYIGDTFKLLASAKDADDLTVDAQYNWFVSIDNGDKIALDTPTANTCLEINGTKYFDYSYNPNNMEYTINPSTSYLNDVYRFHFVCEAVDESGISVEAQSTIVNVPRAVIKAVATTTTTIPTQGVVEANVSFDKFFGYEYDEITFVSTNPAIADVVLDEDFDENHTFKIVANQDRGTMKTGSVQIQARRRDGVYAKIDVTVKYNIADATYTGVSEYYSYTGAAIIDKPVLTYNGIKLVEGSDYTLTLNAVNAGVATITVVPTKNGQFAGTKVITSTIVEKDLADDDIVVTVNPRQSTFVLTDSVREATPSCTVTFGKATLKQGVDYEVSYSNNTKAGTGTIVVTGIGNYSGTKTATFNVVDQASQFTVSAIANQYYTSLQIMPKPTVKYDGKTLTLDKDYTLGYKYNVNVGTATVYIYGTGERFTGTKAVTFKICPKKISGVKAKKAASSITLSWTGDNVTGYQIYNVATKKVIKTITDKNVTSFKITKLSAQKAYSYKVRSFVDISGERYYGAYSAVLYTSTTPKTPTVTLKTTSKTVTASWAKNTAVDGFEYQISLKSSFSGASKVKLAKSATSKKASSLKKGKKYYVRVRSYKVITINGKKTTVYSAWSTKSITCK